MEFGAKYFYVEGIQFSSRNDHEMDSNARTFTTQSRGKYIHGIIGEEYGGCFTEHILNNIKVTEIMNITDGGAEYIRSILGRHCISYYDGEGRSTNENIELYRVKCEVHSAILAYINGYDSGFNNLILENDDRTNWYLPIDHDHVKLYGSVSDTDTDSELNGSLCRQEIKINIGMSVVHALRSELGVPDSHIPSKSSEEISEIDDGYTQQIYEDYVAYRKAIRLHPDRKEELSRICLNKWQKFELL